MLVIPKIELVGGTLTGGVTEQALGSRAWSDLGYSRLLLVDRDAISERGNNGSLVELLTHDSDLEIDLAAGDESTERIEASLELGATRVVVGPRGSAELDWFSGVADNFPSVLLLESSVRERRVVTRGWVRTLPIDLLDLVGELAGVPLAGLLITTPDAGGDGIELDLLEDVAGACECPVFVEEPRPTMAGLYALENRGLAGVVIPARAFAKELDARSVAREFAE
jgi:phosphoribosylformimino-5-aminoimidazole carboxamide ribonucleotide (ProFAR) isomerase